MRFRRNSIIVIWAGPCMESGNGVYEDADGQELEGSFRVPEACFLNGKLFPERRTDIDRQEKLHASNLLHV